MTAAEALSFVERHGIVLESAHHARICSLAEAVVGNPFHGNWWTHPKGRVIFAATRAVRASPDVLVCRLVDGKISFVHARCWPALIRISGRLPRQHLARLHENHTRSGAYRLEETPFPRWVPAATLALAEQLSEVDAHVMLGPLLASPGN